MRRSGACGGIAALALLALLLFSWRPRRPDSQPSPRDPEPKPEPDVSLARLAPPLMQDGRASAPRPAPRGGRRRAGRRTALAALACLVFLAVGIPGAYADGLTFTVTSAADNDDGTCDTAHCTLREAINAANAAPLHDTIAFNISFVGPFQTITGSSALPVINNAVTIDATTQPGYVGTPRIEYRADGVPVSTGMLTFNVNSGTSTIRGLALNRSQAAAIENRSGTTLILRDNYFGVSPDGVTPRGNLVGVFLLGGSNHVVENNLISANQQAGLLMQAVTGATVRGNRIGTNAVGTAALGNGTVQFSERSGIEIGPSTSGGIASGIVIGGAGANQGNLISGNGRSGIDFVSADGSTIDDTVIKGNLIGTDAAGTAGIPNGWHGIHIRGSGVNGTTTDTAIGGVAAGEGNTIAFNQRAGIAIATNAPDAENLRNSIRGNSIHSNETQFGFPELGIDLDATTSSGVTANDPPAALDDDTGANGLQNFPEFDVQVNSTVTGHLNSGALQNYSIDIYSSPDCDPSGNGEGRAFVETVNVTTDGSGHDAFSTTQPLPYPGGFVTATATDSNGNTSEFSACFDVTAGPQTGPTFTVNTNGDAAPADAGCSTADCTLREAIVAANGDGVESVIEFDIAGASHTITPGIPLPPITAEVLIDGTSEPDFGTTPIVEIDGSTVSLDGGNGLELPGSSTVRGLVINDFNAPGNAAILVSGASNVVEGNYLGTNVAGDVARPNRFGIVVTGNDNTIGGETAAARNVISGNTSDNVRITGVGATTNTVAGNYIGTTASGIGALGGGGVRIQSSASTNMIGGATPAARNVIAGNDGNGVEILGDDSTGNDIWNNYIGMGATGLGVVPNTGAGVEIVDPDNNNQVLENLISGNVDGVVVGGSEASTAFQSVELNRIGLDEGEGVPGNSGHGIYLNGGSISDTSDSTINGNEIAGSGGDGIRIDATEGTALRNSLANNRVWNSGGLAIDLVDDTGLPPGTTVGVTPNDQDDVDGGANRFQNFPILTSVTSGGGQTAVEGTLNSTPDRSFAIQFFVNPTCDPSGNGEAQDVFGGTVVVTNSGGDAVISESAALDLEVGDWMTALAQDITTGDTSELSACVQVEAAVGDPQPGPTFTVNTTVDTPPGDAGCTTVDCTLREAIDAANGDGVASSIHFDIPGAGPHTIVPNAVLPKITEQLTIDGTTQDGWVGSPVIEIDGTTATNAGSVGPGLEIGASNSVVRALAINDFLSGFGGIEIEAGTGTVVEASFIGTDVTGMLARPNSFGIEIVGTASDTVIGGSPEARNLISGNAGTAVNIFGPATADTLVKSNFIGLDATGLGVLANGFYGVRIVDTAGSHTVEENLISGNVGGGVVIGGAPPSTTGVQFVRANGIGIDEAGNEVGQGGVGVSIANSSGHLVRANTIAGHSDAGILVDEFGGSATANSFLLNSISNNAGLGIDLLVGGERGVTPNDSDDADEGANLLQNFPDVTFASSSASETTIAGTLHTIPSTTFDIELFQSQTCDDGFHGEGATHLATLAVVTDESGNVSFNTSVTPVLAAGTQITATATGPNGTSEFSQCATVLAANAPFVVNTVADTASDGCDATDCTLREAIEAANSDPGPDEIRFDIPGAGPHTIAPNSGLPPLSDEVVVDGRTEPDYAGAPVVGLEGGGGIAIGLAIASDVATVHGLAIGGFTSYGIDADGGQLELFGSRIGTNLAGTAANANGAGVRVAGFGHVIGGDGAGEGNLVSGNTDQGILVDGGSNNLIQGNRIGTNALGIAALPNTTGIEILSTAADSANANQIGGDEPGQANVISGNTSAGILLRSEIGADGVTETAVVGNVIGVGADGTTDVGNGGDGVQIGSLDGHTGNTIGGTLPGEGNVIANNDGAGVSILNGDTLGNRSNPIRGNSIFDNALGIDLGADGPTPNDDGVLDADTGANDLQNFPVLTFASPSTISGTLDSEPDETYQIHVYENATCGEGGWGTTYLTSFPVTTDGSGTVTFTDAPLGVVATGLVSVTATDSENNTSELSNCIAVTIPTYTVNDDGVDEPSTVGCDETECQLNEAIDASNDELGPARIEFELAVDDEIAVSSTLPALTDEVTIDGANFGEGRVILRDASADVTDGLSLAVGSGGSAVHGFTFQDFQTALRIQSNGNTVRNNRIEGSNVGIRIESGAAGNLIGGSAGSGHGNQIWETLTGIQLESAGTGNEIAGNSIGLDGEGSPTTGEVGIEVLGTNGTTIGDDAAPNELFVMDFSRGNVISGLVGEAGNGIELDGANSTRVTGNFIGTDRAGTADLGNNARGIVVFGSNNNQLGPGNTITHNGSVGLRIASSSGNRIVANSIFDNAGLGIALVEANESVATPPDLQPLDTEGGNTVVNGTVSGTIGQFLFIEYFANSACDPTGNGEGETFLSFSEVTITQESQPFGASFPGLPPDVGITVTATDPATNETSEFSNCATFASVPDTPAPVLFGAVADATPNPQSLGVAGLVDAGQPGAGQSFDVEFFSKESCDPVAPPLASLGTGLGFVTNADGIAGFAKDGLTDVDVGTAVVAVASRGEASSPQSNCVVADRNNTSWHTAFEIGPNSSTTGALRAAGEGRWFKVPILPNSRVRVSLTNLPQDYDLVVFSDIQQAYERLVGTDVDPTLGPNLSVTDLQRAQADAQQDVFNTSQYDSASWDPTNYDPDLNNAVFSASQWSASQWSPSQWSASQWSASQWSPSQWSASQWSPSQWSASQWSPSQWSASQWSPSQWSSSNPTDPRAFSGAQTASLLAVSAVPGTGDENVSANTWNNTGYFYFRVQGKNASFDPEHPFSLTVSREGNLCEGVLDQASSPIAPDGLGTPKTLILTDSRRIDLGTVVGGSTLSARLAALAARPDVEGTIVDVDTFDDDPLDNVPPEVRTLNAQADLKTACPFAKNLVASAIKRIVDAYRKEYPSIAYVVVVGGDDDIPFFRYPDPALLGNENLYVPPVGDQTASQASLRLGYVLSDDFYASEKSVRRKGADFPVPNVATGRLVETPQEIAGMLDAYLGTTNGVVQTPTSSLTTGYDFLTDAADEIAVHLREGIGATGANRTLITDQSVSPGLPTEPGTAPTRDRAWTADNLRGALLGPQRNDLIFLAGHFSANDALAADYKTNILTTEVPPAPTNMVNSIVFSAGCHTGYNIVNGHATPWTEPLDWAQAFAQKRATLIAGTGYQYGDTDFIAHGERIYVEFARQLRVSTLPNLAPEPVAVGRALLRSKQVFLEQTPGLTALDEKTLLQTTLFGLPMLSVNLPQGRVEGGDKASIVTQPESVTTGPGAELGLKVAEVVDLGTGVPTAPESKALTGLTGTEASWYEGPDGVAVRPTQPILPLKTVNVTPTDPSLALRGVGFRGGTYEDEGGTTPLTGAPATELRGIHAPFFTEVFFPTQPWALSYFSALDGGPTFLHLTPVQHRSESPTMTRRVFSNLDLDLFYSGNVTSYCPDTFLPTPPPCPQAAFGPVGAVTPALAAPPTITGVETSLDGTVLTVRARVVGDPFAGIQKVWVTWTIPPGLGQTGIWQSFDLTQDDADETLWTGELDLGQAQAGDVHFVVQAVNGVGRHTIDDNLGATYRPGSIPGAGTPPGEDPPAPTELELVTPPPASVVYRNAFSVTVELTSEGAPVEGALVKVGFGANGLPGVTGADGRATVELLASLQPGPYTIVASYGGDADHAQANAFAGTTIVPRDTTLTLGGSFTLAPSSVHAILTAAPDDPLHQRTLYLVFTGTGPANVGYRDVFTNQTDPTGRVDVTDEFLAQLPAGNYRIDAYFNGVNVPGVITQPPESPEYEPATATANLVFRPAAGSLLDQAIALLEPLAALPGARGDKAEDALMKLQAARSKLSRREYVGALGELEGAAGDLEAAIKSRLFTAAQLRPILDLITGAAWTEALAARDRALARGGNARKIAEANTSITQGNQRWAQSRWKDAIARYKDAVAKAESA